MFLNKNKFFKKWTKEKKTVTKLATRETFFFRQSSPHLCPKVLKLEGGEETEGAEVEGHDWQDRLLEQRARVQQGAIAAQADHKINLVREVVLVLGEGHELVLYVAEARVLHQQGIVHDLKSNQLFLVVESISIADLITRMSVHPSVSL